MDLNVRAFQRVQAALAEPLAPDERRRNKAARAGGLAGGRSRAKSRSESRKREIALEGSSACWSRNEPATDSQGKERQ